MGHFISLNDVYSCMSSKKFKQFSAAEVWIGNYVAPNPFPCKFTYSACSFRSDTGSTCGKSVEFGRKCSHSNQPQPAFRFQVILFDCHHAGVQPLLVNLWQAVATLLSCSASAFSACTEAEQLEYVRALVETTPRVKIHLSSRDGQVSVSSLSMNEPSTVDLPMSIQNCCDPPASPGFRTPPSGPSSAKKHEKKAGPSRSEARALVRQLGELFSAVDLGSDDE